MADVWVFGPGDGQLLLRTGVEGRAARLGHRLTIEMTRWRAEVAMRDGEPASLDVEIEVDGLEVRQGVGGVKLLTTPEKALVRTNALSCLDAKTYGQITFQSDAVDASADGYRAAGTLTIHGTAQPFVLDVTATEESFSIRCGLQQTDFGVRPYSQMMGSLKVSDEVEIECTVPHPPPP